MPLIFPAVISAALLVFTLSLDDYVITSFVAGPGSATLPLKIYSMVKTGVTPEINAISTVLLAVTMLLVLCFRADGDRGRYSRWTVGCRGMRACAAYWVRRRGPGSQRREGAS